MQMHGITSHPVEDPVYIILTSVSRSPMQSVFLCVPSGMLNTFLLSSCMLKCLTHFLLHVIALFLVNSTSYEAFFGSSPCVLYCNILSSYGGLLLLHSPPPAGPPCIYLWTDFLMYVPLFSI